MYCLYVFIFMYVNFVQSYAFEMVLLTRGKISFGGFPGLPDPFWSRSFCSLNLLFLPPMIIQQFLTMARMCVIIFFFSLSISHQHHNASFKGTKTKHNVSFSRCCLVRFVYSQPLILLAL